MTLFRESRLSMLHPIADGGDVTGQELDIAVPDPSMLDREEKRGREELSHWADDADIRAKDENHARFKRDWIRERIAAWKMD
ncbi:MAG: hypothetical protein AB7E05_03810 [Sphingobium sp.]